MYIIILQSCMNKYNVSIYKDPCLEGICIALEVKHDLARKGVH